MLSLVLALCQVLWRKQCGFRLNLSSRKTWSSHFNCFICTHPVSEVCCVAHNAYLVNLADTLIYFSWPQNSISYSVVGVLYPPTQGRQNFLLSTVFPNEFMYITGHIEYYLWIISRLLSAYIFPTWNLNAHNIFINFSIYKA